MSLIYGAISIEEQVKLDHVQLLRDELKQFPTDEFDSIQEKNIAGGVYSIRLRKPPFPQEKCMIDENGIILIADARLDYRQDLLKKLDLDQALLYQLSDTQLILKAFQKWNRECIHYLEGDFSFFLFDSKKKEIWGARDPIGLRPLFFLQKEKHFYFSSSNKALLKLKLFIHGINKPFWANRILHLECSPSATPHEDIFQLPIGHKIDIHNYTFKSKQYFKWKKSPISENPQERAIKLQKLIDQAVESRFYPDYEVGCQLSGGLDSSAVTAMVSKKLKQKKPEQKLWTVSSVADKEKGHKRDERPWVEMFAKKFKNISTYLVSFEGNTDYDKRHNDLFAFLRFRRHSCYPISKQFTTHLLEKNCKTVLTGWRGDHFVSRHSLYSINDLLIKGKWGYLLKNFRRMAKWRGLSAKTVFKKMIKINAPFLFYHKEMIPFLNPNWVGELKDKIKSQKKKNNRWKLRGVEWDLQRFLPVNEKALPFYMEDISHLYQKPIVTLHPLSDARVIAYTLNFKGSDYEINGMDRGIFREATKGILPEEIRLRNRKGFFIYEELKQFQHMLPQFLEENQELIENSPMGKLVETEKVLHTIQNFIDRPTNGVDINLTFSLNFLGYLLYFANNHSLNRTTNDDERIYERTKK